MNTLGWERSARLPWELVRSPCLLWRFTATDKITAAVTAIGIALWLLNKNPLMAMLFSIAADFVSGIPTIIKSIKDRSSERALPYFLSLMSMVCTLAAIQDWTVAAYAFPLYILFTNTVFFGLIASRVGPRTRRWWHAKRLLATASIPE